MRILVRIGNRADEVRAMGCDIHAMMERRWRWPNEPRVYEWQNAGKPRLDRDYLVFEALAGVRPCTDASPIASARGVPEHPEAPCQEFTAWHESWRTDAHHTSWVTLAEIKAHRAPTDNGTVVLRWTELIEDMERVKRPGDTDDDVRLVFFFDN